MSSVGELRRYLDELYPPSSAESWDRVGLVTGDQDDQVRGILLTVDVTDAVIEQAIELGANLIIAHHPLLLRGISTVDPSQPKGRMITELIRNRIALLTAHTNADIPSGGVAEALASALGLEQTRPLQESILQPLDQLITYVPSTHTDAVLDALADAGAGAIGRYERCAYRSPGTGTFRALPGAAPAIGVAGEQQKVAEDRLELIMKRSLRGPVLAALNAAHPYEEPAFQVIEVDEPRSTGARAGMGRVGQIDPVRLGDFARLVARVLPTTAAGVRVAGDPQRMITTVALQGGAGDGLLDVARLTGADVYLTSDLRHHPASEAIAWDGAPALIDVPHWAAEWTWLPVLRSTLQHHLDAETPITVSELRTDPWDFIAR